MFHATPLGTPLVKFANISCYTVCHGTSSGIMEHPSSENSILHTLQAVTYAVLINDSSCVDELIWIVIRLFCGTYYLDWPAYCSTCWSNVLGHAVVVVAWQYGTLSVAQIHPRLHLHSWDHLALHWNPLVCVQGVGNHSPWNSCRICIAHSLLYTGNLMSVARDGYDPQSPSMNYCWNILSWNFLWHDSNLVTVRFPWKNETMK